MLRKDTPISRAYLQDDEVIKFDDEGRLILHVALIDDFEVDTLAAFMREKDLNQFLEALEAEKGDYDGAPYYTTRRVPVFMSAAEALKHLRGEPGTQ